MYIMDRISTFLLQLLGGQNHLYLVLILLVLLIVIFSVVTFFLFVFTSYLRVNNNRKERWEKRNRKQWDKIFLAVMDERMSPQDAYRQIKHRESISYLLCLEQYISIVKGVEKDRLVSLGRMSLGKLHRLIDSSKRKNRLYGIHLLSLFHPEEQMKYVKYDSDDIESSLTMIRELAKVDKYEIKEQLLRLLFQFRYVSPVYLSTIMAEMGSEIIPLLVMIVEYQTDDPFRQMVAIEALRRLHYSKGAELSKHLLENNMHPLVSITCLSFIEEMGDETYQNIVRLYMKHPDPSVRSAAAQAYIAIAPTLTEKDIAGFFDDPSVLVAVRAAKKLREKDLLPYISVKAVDYLKWGIVYKRMVF